eukprot:2039607-Pyramimonas_sp.AAC.1
MIKLRGRKQSYTVRGRVAEVGFRCADSHCPVAAVVAPPTTCGATLLDNPSTAPTASKGVSNSGEGISKRAGVAEHGYDAYGGLVFAYAGVSFWASRFP